MVERQAITLPDNVRRTLNLLDQKSFKYSSIILVNSPYVQRRGWAHFQKYVDDHIRLIRINSATQPALQKANWFKSEVGIKVIANEFC